MPSFERASILVLGRLNGLTRQRLSDLVAQTGGRLAARASGRLTHVVIAHGTARVFLNEAPYLTLPRGVPVAVERMSEGAFKRRLGLSAPPAPEPRTLDEAALAKLSGLRAEEIAALALYDVIEPIEGRFGYRDLVSARGAERLLRAGARLADVVEAAVALGREGLKLAEARVAGTASGEILQVVDGRFSGLDGQLRLPFEQPFESADQAFERAEGCEAEGDLAGAERWYRAAARLDRRDPVIPFNLGNVLRAQDRLPEATLAWRLAVERDAGFSEAWFNLAVAAEEAERHLDAAQHYRRALDSRPDYADAAFNLGLLLTEHERFEEAAPLWDLYLALSPQAPDAPLARRYAALCRMQGQDR